MTAVAAPPAGRSDVGPGYKWIALSNTTIGMLMATVNSSIVLISLPAIFRGINLNPLTPGNVSYLLWMLMGYMVVTAVLVVSLGRIGDMFGRVRMYNLGFLVFTIGSILLSVVFFTGPNAALALILFRLVQGVGGAMLFANSTAILTDAFPANQRGMALGINAVAAISGSFIGLIVGGLLSTVNWHVIFLISVPVGLFGTVWAFLKLREIGVVKRARIDWWGNLTFGVGLISLLVGITYGIQPYGGSTMGWTNPTVLAEIIGGIALLVVFVIIELRVDDPMFNIGLFRSRAFAFGTIAGLLASIGRGGLMFMIIIWLQGIWLPLHGYNYESTPFWSAIFMLPLTVGFLFGGPISGYLSDRLGARLFATGGMVLAALTFGLLTLLPADFSYAPFAILLFANGLSMGMFISPNTAGVMNSVPPDRRGVASGMLATFQNSGMTLSIGIFFSLMIAGLSSTLPSTLYGGLTAHGVNAGLATVVAHEPPVGSLFAAFLGYNPVSTLLGPSLSTLQPAQAAFLTGQTFFPNLISTPFVIGMHITFFFSMGMTIVAAAASFLRGGMPRRFTRTAPALAVPAPAAGGSNGAGPARIGAPGPVPKPVVTISAPYGALGSRIAPLVAERLGVPFLDRAISLQTAQRLHVPLSDVPEGEPVQEPALARAIASVVDTPQFGATPPVEADGRAPEEVLLEVTDQVMHDAAQRTGGVLLGRGGMVVLRDVPAALHVRLDGPEEARLKQAVATGIPEPDARKALHQTDRAREAYLRAMLGVNPHDPTLYDLVIDSTKVPVEAAVTTIVDAATSKVHAAVP